MDFLFVFQVFDLCDVRRLGGEESADAESLAAFRYELDAPLVAARVVHPCRGAYLVKVFRLGRAAGIGPSQDEANRAMVGLADFGDRLQPGLLVDREWHRLYREERALR